MAEINPWEEDAFWPDDYRPPAIDIIKLDCDWPPSSYDDSAFSETWWSNHEHKWLYGIYNAICSKCGLILPNGDLKNEEITLKSQLLVDEESEKKRREHCKRMQKGIERAKLIKDEFEKRWRAPVEKEQKPIYEKEPIIESRGNWIISCVVCGRRERLSEVISWHVCEIGDRQFFACPKEFPNNTDDEYKKAFQSFLDVSWLYD